MKPSALRLVAALLFSAGLASAAELRVYAAASLSDALTELAPLHAKTTGDKIRFNFGASGTLARQIKEGAPADLFISADEPRLDQLANENLLLPETRRALFANSLVLVVPADRPAPARFVDLVEPSIHRIAIGQPDIVPAGSYARAHLQQLKLWEPLQSKLVHLDNVRAVLSAVETGNADAGIVYRTDALASKKVKIAVAVPRDEGPAIIYPAAVIAASSSPDAARTLLDWLASPVAREVFTRHGFEAVPAAR